MPNVCPMYAQSRWRGARLRSSADPQLARRRANAVRRLAPAFVSPQAFRAATLAASGYGGERQSRRECRLGDTAVASAADENKTPDGPMSGGSGAGRGAIRRVVDPPAGSQFRGF